MDLQQAYEVLVNSLRDDTLPDAERRQGFFTRAARTNTHVESHEHDGDEDEREVTGNSVPRPMSFFMGGPSANTTQQRAANNADDDSPLVMRPVLLAPPDKRKRA